MNGHCLISSHQPVVSDLTDTATTLDCYCCEVLILEVSPQHRLVYPVLGAVCVLDLGCVNSAQAEKKLQMLKVAFKSKIKLKLEFLLNI